MPSDHAAIPVVLHPLHGPGLDAALLAVPGLSLTTPDDDAGVATAIAGGDEVLVTYRWDDSFIAPGLRWVHAISAGVDHFPEDDLRSAGIILTSSRGAHAPAVAEHALALLLTLTRGIGTAAAGAEAREWRSVPTDEVGMMTVGILGLGSIGEAVATRLAALGARVIGTKADPTGYAGVASLVLPPDDILAVFAAADAVISCLPGGPRTNLVVDDAAFEALGEGWFVNIGRGSTVDEAALAHALTHGGLRGAAVDVTAVEPLPADAPLWEVENLLITPHAAWQTPHLTPRLMDVFRANLDAYRGGGTWATRVV